MDSFLFSSFSLSCRGQIDDQGYKQRKSCLHFFLILCSCDNAPSTLSQNTQCTFELSWSSPFFSPTSWFHQLIASVFIVVGRRVDKIWRRWFCFQGRMCSEERKIPRNLRHYRDYFVAQLGAMQLQTIYIQCFTDSTFSFLTLMEPSAGAITSVIQNEAFDWRRLVQHIIPQKALQLEIKK